MVPSPHPRPHELARTEADVVFGSLFCMVCFCYPTTTVHLPRAPENIRIVRRENFTYLQFCHTESYHHRRYMHAAARSIIHVYLDHYDLIPRDIGQLIHALNLTRLHLTFSHGRWQQKPWGYSDFPAPHGVELYAVLPIEWVLSM